MGRVRIVEDLEECSYLWGKHFPLERVFDFWEFRWCFSDAYSREASFIVYEEGGALKGLLPLSRIQETGAYAYFPGETWEGKTWIEQNKIIINCENVLPALIEAVPAKANIRYLCTTPHFGELPETGGGVVSYDETDYYFQPAVHDYSYENYLASFPGKSRKKILAEVNAIKAKGLEVRINDLKDVDTLYRMNLDNFGSQSFFYDPRFLNGFERMIAFLDSRGMLRIVTLIVGGKIAAVDVGGTWNKHTVFLGGGTHRDFPGIAKLINLYHMEWACQEKLVEMDFLCGDFGWKERFRLSQRHLFQIDKQRAYKKYSVEDIERPRLHV